MFAGMIIEALLRDSLIDMTGEMLITETADLIMVSAEMTIMAGTII